MNKFKNLLARFWSKNFLIIALLVSFFAVSGNFSAANGQPGRYVFRLKEVREFYELNKFVSVVEKGKLDANGGYVSVHVNGNATVKGEPLCAGGSEVMHFRWKFPQDMSQIATGNGISVSVQARHGGGSPPCKGQIAGGAYITAMGSDGAPPFLAQNFGSLLKFIDDNRISRGNGELIKPDTGDFKGANPAMTIKDYEPNPDKPYVFFVIMISTGGGYMYYAYVYETVSSGNSTSPPVNETNNQMPETSPTPEIFSSPTPADTENPPGPTTIGVNSNANRTNANSNTSSKGNKGGCFGLIILIATGLLGVAATRGKNAPRIKLSQK